MDELTLPARLPGAKADTLMWAQPWEVEPAALDQLRNISKLQWVEAVRVMPDVHLGKGATVGSVIAMKDAVSPSAVGVDIGCGMRSVKTSLTINDLPDSLGKLREAIEKVIPVGFNSHGGIASVNHDAKLKNSVSNLFGRFKDLRAPDVADRESRAMSQCGTLGGGNHFIEVCLDDNGAVWLMLHSGSRNIGKELAERHINKAKSLSHNLDLPDRDLAVFLSETNEMNEYLHDLHWAQEYAALNRDVMMHLLKNVIMNEFSNVSFKDDINCHHNYVAHETYNDEDVIVTRKGAIRAGSGDYGLIPGSMGTGSFVVRGLGNEMGLNSASHGAGRKMSRSKAKKKFTVDDLAEQTLNVECRKDKGVVDEIPGAYKDLESVIKAQTEGDNPLVEVVARLTTVLCVKG